MRFFCPAKRLARALTACAFDVRRCASPLPKTVIRGAARRLYSKFSLHWGIARPNRRAILVRLKRQGGLGNDHRTNKGHQRFCSRRRGKELYRSVGTHRSVEVGGGQKCPAPRRPLGRPPAAANDAKRLANRGG